MNVKPWAGNYPSFETWLF